MEEYLDVEAEEIGVAMPPEEPAIKLKEAIYLSDIVNNKGVLFEVADNPVNDDDAPNNASYFADEDIVKYMNPSLQSGDSESDEDGEDDSLQFERLARRMDNVSDDGGVRKQVKRKGAGEIVPKGAVVTIHYNCYTEYGDEPYDSTRLRNKPLRVRLGSDMLVRGLEVGICTMRTNEIARFLVQPEYGYGSMGCPPRIPGNAVILFEVELLDFLDYDAAVQFEGLSVDERKVEQFDKVIGAAKAEYTAGVDYFNNKVYAKALQRYQKAVRLLDFCSLRDKDDEDVQQRWLLRLFLNLSLCYMRTGDDVKVLFYCRKALEIEPKNIKALYRRGVAKTNLGEYMVARDCLVRAKRQEPRSREINAALAKLDQKEASYRAHERLMCAHMFDKAAAADGGGSEVDAGASSKDKSKEEVASEFKEMVCDKLGEFVDDDRLTEISFPGHLTFPELACLNEVADEFGLDIDFCDRDNSGVVVISKLKKGN